MDGHDFDRLARHFGDTLSRRRLGGLLAVLGLGVAGAADAKPKKKKKKKKKPCAAGTIRCGTACVDARNDITNCGGCGNRCGNGQTCASGQCQGGGGCTGGQVSCNGQCVNTQTDNRHCGGCGNACGSGKRCVGGQCVEQPECASQAECGGSQFNDLVCRNGRCVCADETKGICHRFPDGRGTCHICCPGGSGQCPGNRNETCFYYQTPSGVWAGLCNCPTGWDRCNSSLCVEDYSTDPRHCGPSCTDCQANLDVNPKGICCNGGCVRGCNPGTSGSGCFPDSPCGPNCNPCGEGSICCNMGPGTQPRCIPNVNGFCYLN